MAILTGHKTMLSRYLVPVVVSKGAQFLLRFILIVLGLFTAGGFTFTLTTRGIPGCLKWSFPALQVQPCTDLSEKTLKFSRETFQKHVLATPYFVTCCFSTVYFYLLTLRQNTVPVFPVIRLKPQTLRFFSFLSVICSKICPYRHFPTQVCGGLKNIPIGLSASQTKLISRKEKQSPARLDLGIPQVFHANIQTSL